MQFQFLCQGEAILFAPKRGPTFEKFKKLAKKSFDVAVVENYDEEIWQMHLVFFIDLFFALIPFHFVNDW